MENPIEIEIQVISHATEDPHKILGAFKEMFGIDEDDFSVKELTGHFDNPIILMQCRLKKKKSKNFVKSLVAAIPKSEMDLLIDTLEERCDESALFLRVSKQDLIRGKVVLDGEDPVKVRIFTPSYSRRDIAKVYSEILEGTV